MSLFQLWLASFSSDREEGGVHRDVPSSSRNGPLVLDDGDGSDALLLRLKQGMARYDDDVVLS